MDNLTLMSKFSFIPKASILHWILTPYVIWLGAGVSVLLRGWLHGLQLRDRLGRVLERPVPAWRHVCGRHRSLQLHVSLRLHGAPLPGAGSE